MVELAHKPVVVGGLAKNVGTAEPVVGSTEAGEYAAYSQPSPERDEGEPNEDSAAILPVDGGFVLVVADGIGGMSGGAEASTNAVKILVGAVAKADREHKREAILDGFEKANAALRSNRRRGQTTLVVAEIKELTVRTYNVGDSTALVVGGGGKIKQQTVAHSPVGYGVAAGLIDEQEALHHDELHLITNTVGADEMRIDVGPVMELAPRDTLVLGSDGLFDNLHLDEIAELVRKGPIGEAATDLAKAATERMSTPSEGAPSKPDDLTFVLFRPASR
jgi:serine/threonine protein phosphatase PrpC